MKKITLLLTCLLSITFTHSALAGKIVKWVDENGKVHYGDKPPMPTKTKKSKVLNNQGVTVGTIDQTRKNTNVSTKNIAQSRKDAALLASYNSVEEIDLAKDRNTKIDKIALESLQTKLKNLDQSLAKNVGAQERYTSKNKPVPEKLSNEEKSIIAKIRSTKEQIKTKEKDIAATNARYENDKKRYEELKPRSYALNTIKEKQRSLADLQAWRNEAQDRVNYYQDKITSLKRSNLKLSQNDRKSYLNAVREVERADAEIHKTKLAIQQQQNTLSQ